MFYFWCGFWIVSHGPCESYGCFARPVALIEAGEHMLTGSGLNTPTERSEKSSRRGVGGADVATAN